MRLKLIKPGTFMMGSPNGDDGASEDEHPKHSVEITRPFYLGVFPVTQVEYIQVTGRKNPSWFSKEGNGKDAAVGLDTSRFPVEQVSWDEAVLFCEALNRQDANRRTGWRYSLPTEAEWEYACRAGSKTAHFFGGDSTDLSDYAWFDGNSQSRTHTLGTLKPNPWGLYDMNGNVWQWCSDWYNKDYYGNSSNKDPQCDVIGVARVVRGGSWYYAAWGCRAAFRRSYAPGARQLHRVAGLFPPGLIYPFWRNAPNEYAKQHGLAKARRVRFNVNAFVLVG